MGLVSLAPGEPPVSILGESSLQADEFLPLFDLRVSWKSCVWGVHAGKLAYLFGISPPMHLDRVV